MIVTISPAYPIPSIDDFAYLESFKDRSMKKIFCLLCLAVSVTASSQQTDEMRIRTLLDEQTKAWNRGDLVNFMKGYWKNDSLMFIGKSGVTYGWEATLNNYKKRISRYCLNGKTLF